MNKKGQNEGLWVTLVIAGIFMFIVFTFFTYKGIQPWLAQQTGKAELAQAEQNRQIAVLEATAKKESAVQLAQAEVERAKGVAQANQIIGESLKNNEDYLRYLWITDVAGASVDKTVVYVPTETNLPLLEAGRKS
jgi:regulator of protease activity HflC (stomatin/prohibitin superfamily)